MSLCGKKLWTIGGGKGGVGVSFLTASMGTALARTGKSVILVDANLPAPDLHAYLGIRNPDLTLLDVLAQRATLPQALVETPEPQMRFLSCVGDELGMADRTPKEWEEMAECLTSLDADFVLIDAGSGASRRVLDLFNLAQEAIVVTSPEAASMRCTFRFIRNATYRRVQERFGANPEVNSALAGLREHANQSQPTTMTKYLDFLRLKAPEVALDIAKMLSDWRPFLLVNLAVSEQELHNAEIIHTSAWKFLNVDLRSGNPIPFDESLRKANQGMRLPEGSDPASGLAQQIRHTTLLLASIDQPGADANPTEKALPVVPAQAMGLNDNLAFMGRAIHVQTEDLGAAGNCITTQVFCEGRVILSTRSEYPSTMREQNQNERLIELMRAQHFNIIRQIESRQSKLQPGVS